MEPGRWYRVLESTCEADSLRSRAWRLGCTGWVISLRKKQKLHLEPAYRLALNSFHSTSKKKL